MQLTERKSHASRASGCKTDIEDKLLILSWLLPAYFVYFEYMKISLFKHLILHV